MWFCLLSTGVFGFFISIDMFTMFMFYEVALIPMYLLIGVWGSGNKNYSAMKLTLMLMGGGTSVSGKTSEVITEENLRSAFSVDVCIRDLDVRDGKYTCVLPLRLA